LELGTVGENLTSHDGARPGKTTSKAELSVMAITHQVVD